MMTIPMLKSGYEQVYDDHSQTNCDEDRSNYLPCGWGLHFPLLDYGTCTYPLLVSGACTLPLMQILVSCLYIRIDQNHIGNLCCVYECHDVDGVLSYTAVLVTFTISPVGF
jgi:hypothetical protein